MSGPVLGFDQASAIVSRHAKSVSARSPLKEWMPLAQAAGRVLACPLIADSDQPPFTRSTRDGYACRAAQASTHAFIPLSGSIRAGDSPRAVLDSGSLCEVMTGAPVPEGADAVAMLEHVEVVDGRVRLLPPRSIRPGENLVPRGVQARAGDELLPAGTAMAAPQIALAAFCGYREIEVFVRPRVAILTTGDELVPVEAVPGDGKIRNSNAPMLAAMVAAAGGEPWILPAAEDNPAALDGALAQAIEAELLLISGGVSAGKFDLVEPALERLGAQFHFTGVRIQPGKPLVFGELPALTTKAGQNENGAKHFFGLPGNPISSAVTFLLFAAPMLGALAGSRQPAPRFALAQLACSTGAGAKPGLMRFLPASCNFESAGPLPAVAEIPWHGSGDLTAFARSNCFLVIPEEAAGIEKGAIVRILLH